MDTTLIENLLEKVHNALQKEKIHPGFCTLELTEKYDHLSASTKPIPKKIKINWRVYDIEHGEHRAGSHGGDLYGSIMCEDNNIYIYEKLDNDNQWVALLHEIIHGIFYFAGQGDLFKNEDVINLLAENLYQVLRENKLCFDDA